MYFSYFNGFVNGDSTKNRLQTHSKNELEKACDLQYNNVRMFKTKTLFRRRTTMRSFYIVIAIIFVSLLSSCSHGFGDSPGDIILGSPGLASIGDAPAPPVYVTSRDSSGNPVAGMGLMGIFAGRINLPTMQGELTSLRQGSMTDTLEVVDITNFLQLAPCSNCVKMSSISLDPDGHPVVKIGIKHPFPAGDPFKPITGRNRADLHVFNVEGIVASASGDVTSFPSLNMTISNYGLHNADGYSAYLDPYLDEILQTPANVHPYILHFDDYSQGNFAPGNSMGFESVTDPPPTGNLVMAMGCDYSFKDYVFDVPATQDIQFLYAVGCTYAITAASKSQRFAPEYRIPQDNKKAASEVWVEISQNDLKAGDVASTAGLTIKVLDINHGVAVGDDLDKMAHDSSVAGIFVEVPGITSGATSSFTPTGGNGRDPADPLTFSVTITNTSGAGEGTYTGIAKVLDSYPPGQNGAPSLNGKDGIKRVDPLIPPTDGLFDITEFATYARFEIEVSTANLPPVASLLPNPAYACIGNNVMFDATASVDPDGSIIRYEWDWDLPSGDPLQFAMDETTTVGTATSPVYPVMASKWVAVRVYDNGTPALYDTEVVPLSIYDTDLIAYPDIKPITTTGLMNINFSHTQDTLQNQTYLPCHGMEGMASADGYVYAVFYAEEVDKGIYFMRSSDRGDTWSTPTKVATIPGSSVYGGCAIDAVGSGVYIEYSSSGAIQNTLTNNGDIYLLSNMSHGDGAFTETVVRDMPDGTALYYTELAIDPLDTNNVYVAYGQAPYSTPTYNWHYYDKIRVSISHTGPTGPFTETVLQGADHEFDGNDYGLELAVSPVDGDFYIFTGDNTQVAMYRSDDHGATFPTDAAHFFYNFTWGSYWNRDFDMALSPKDGDLVYVIFASRIDLFNIKVWKATDGITLREITTSVSDASCSLRIQPSITVGPYGDVYAAWADNRTGDLEIYADHMPPSGSFGADIHISAGNNTQERDPEIILTPDSCDALIVWEENGDQPGGTLNSRKG